MEVNRRTIDQDDTKLAVRSPGKIAFPDLSEVGGIFRDTKIQRKAKKLLEGSHEPGLVLHTHTIPYAHAHPMITPAELSMYKLDNMVNHMKSGVGFSWRVPPPEYWLRFEAASTRRT